MPSPSDPTDELTNRRLSQLAVHGEDDLIDEDPDDDPALDIEYRGRGRPKLPPEQRRREKLVIALTGEELKTFMIEAASVEGGPMRVQDWARRELLRATKKEKP